MHWKELRAREGRWLGLELTVGKRPTPPAWRVEFASPSVIRLSCEGSPLLWARIAPYYQGFWWLSAPAVGSGPLKPLRADEVDAISELPGTDGWYAAWARHFARLLALSQRSPLHEGCWQLLRGLPQDDTQVARWAIVRGTERYPSQPLAGYENWGAGDTNLLFGLKPSSELSPSRLKVWRKRVRDGTLPPVLALFVTSLDCFVVLDGHHRWMASIEERKPVPLLTLCPVQARNLPPRADLRPVVERLQLQQDSGHTEPRPIDVAGLNKLALEAWAGETYVWPLTRAWPIPGRLPRWVSEVRARLDALGVAVEPGLRAHLLRAPGE